MPDLTGLPALDVAIGLGFIYLVLSLLAAAVQEAIAGVLALRAATLEKGLRNMLEKDSALPPDATPQTAEIAPARNLVDELYGNPLIAALYKQSWWPLKGSSRPRTNEPPSPTNSRKPSYISPRSFALALVDTLAPNALAPQDGKLPESHDAVAAVRVRLVGIEPSRRCKAPAASAAR